MLDHFRTIEVGNGQHVLHLMGAFVDHACEPSCYVDKILNTVTAIRNIEPGENITFDYSISEEIINSPFSCLCGSKNCRGYIK